MLEEEFVSLRAISKVHVEFYNVKLQRQVTGKLKLIGTLVGLDRLLLYHTMLHNVKLPDCCYFNSTNFLPGLPAPLSDAVMCTKLFQLIGYFFFFYLKISTKSYIYIYFFKIKKR